MPVRKKNWAPDSTILAWQIPWTEEPGGPAVHGVTRSRTPLNDFTSLFTFMRWRRKWQLIPVSLPRESQGQGSMIGCHLWGRTESDTTEAT